MTEELHFHLGTFALITAVPFFGRMLFLARWGEATRQNPPVVGLQIAMVGISFNCLVWSLTPNLWALTTVEILSGIFWGGFEFITVLMMQEYLPGDARGAIGFHVCLSNFAATAGALLGSALLNLNFHYVEVFRISAGLRFSIALIFILIGMRLLEEKRSSFQPFKFLKLLFRVQLNG